MRDDIIDHNFNNLKQSQKTANAHVRRGSFWHRFSVFHSVLIIVSLTFLLGFGGLLYSAWAIRNQMMVQKGAEIQHVVEVAGTIASGYAQRAERGELSLVQAQASALADIRNIKFDGSNYVFVFTTDGNVVYHPRADLAGKNLSDAKDPAGNYFARLIGEAAKRGGGFANYVWLKPGQTDASAKVTYVYSVPQWNWAIGAGHWVDDVDATLRETALHMAEIMLPFIGLIVFIMILMTRNINRLLSGLALRMGDVAAGHLDADILAQDRTDEIGSMARALQTFKDAALMKISTDAIHEVERKRNEDSRIELEHITIERERTVVVESFGNALAHLARKDLTFRMTDRLPQAYANLQTDFNDAQEQLEGAMEQVMGSVHLISSAAEQITSAADDLSRRTEQQAAGLEQASAALAQVTDLSNRTAQGATEAAAVIGATGTNAQSSSAVVHNAVEAMQRIETASNKISQILGTIDEIAFQTNLLALNAGIEAARAGDAGLGFAVVAQEVRALAARCTEAARESKNLILGSSAAVSLGVDLVDSTGQSLVKIISDVQGIERIAAKIATGAREQAASLAEVNVVIGQMDVDTQNNAAMVEETTAATHGLRREMDDLMRALTGFNIRQDNGEVKPQPIVSAEPFSRPAKQRRA